MTPTDRVSPTNGPPSDVGFSTLVRNRRAVRRFRPDPVPEQLIVRLLDTARHAPSAFNYQPTRFILVTDKGLRRRLKRACLNQRQVMEAPAIIVLTADRRLQRTQLDRIIGSDIATGAIDAEYGERLRRLVSFALARGPLGLGLLLKSVLVPFLRLFKPMPAIPAANMRLWLTKQAMLPAMILLLAAAEAGLATAPMEGFDERRVKRVLGLPCSVVVPLVIAMGYPADTPPAKSRLPLSLLLHRNGW